jgi:hypothetical protein
LPAPDKAPIFALEKQPEKSLKAMKKIISILAAAAMLPALAAAQRTTTKVYFEGEAITGIEASSAFDVVLIKSLRTKAVVDIDNNLAPYVEISRGGDGIVHIELDDVPNRLWREFNRLPAKDRVQKLTLHLPSLTTVRMSGAADLTSTDIFPGENVDIQLSGACDIKGALAVSSEKVKIQCSGASDGQLILDKTRELTVVASGACDLTISARGLDYSKIGASGASDITLTGDGGQGEWTASGASEIHAERFAARDVSINVNGASSARVNASNNLTTKTSGASSVRYAGKPASINNLSDDVKPL